MATCYRHPGRETAVSCSNCDRPICPDCMTPTPVGMRCPECARQKTQVRTAASIRRAGDALPVTKALIAVNVIAYLGELATGTGGLNGVGGSLVDQGALLGRGLIHDGGGLHLVGVAEGEWWRLITGGFLHASIIHIGFNMYLLWILGQMLEPVLGSVRFSAIYVVSLLAGSFGALLLEPHGFTVGASGAVFGLMGAAFFELRSRGIDPFQAGIGWLIVLNLVLGFVLNNISVGGHIGGLIGGALAALALQLGDRQRNPALGLAACLLIGVVAAAAAIAVAGSAGLGTPRF
jgi:membrane associated rhomboid family serine protease